MKLVAWESLHVIPGRPRSSDWRGPSRRGDDVHTAVSGSAGGDPRTMLTALVVLAATALMATYLPVRRALAANPIADSAMDRGPSFRLTASAKATAVRRSFTRRRKAEATKSHCEPRIGARTASRALPQRLAVADSHRTCVSSTGCDP